MTHLDPIDRADRAARSLRIERAAQILAVRELHKPRHEDHDYDLVCYGCEFSGMDGEPPHWPCRTADVVYTAAEIFEVTADYRLVAKWRNAMRWRNRSLAPPRSLGEHVNDLLRAAIGRNVLLPYTNLARTAAEQPPVTKIRHLIQIPREALRDI